MSGGHLVCRPHQRDRSGRYEAASLCARGRLDSANAQRRSYPEAGTGCDGGGGGRLAGAPGREAVAPQSAGLMRGFWLRCGAAPKPLGGCPLAFGPWATGGSPRTRPPRVAVPARGPHGWPGPLKPDSVHPLVNGPKCDRLRRHRLVMRIALCRWRDPLCPPHHSSQACQAITPVRAATRRARIATA